jgi:hypothetical protein
MKVSTFAFSAFFTLALGAAIPGAAEGSYT